MRTTSTSVIVFSENCDQDPTDAYRWQSMPPDCTCAPLRNGTVLDQVAPRPSESPCGWTKCSSSPPDDGGQTRPRLIQGAAARSQEDCCASRGGRRKRMRRLPTQRLDFALTILRGSCGAAHGGAGEGATMDAACLGSQRCTHNDVHTAQAVDSHASMTPWCCPVLTVHPGHSKRRAPLRNRASHQVGCARRAGSGATDRRGRAAPQHAHRAAPA